MTVSDTHADELGDIDLMDPALYLDSREDEAFARLRAVEPVHWNPPSDNGPGFWALTSYAAVRAAASDHERLSSAQGTQIMDRKVEGKLASIHHMDEPEHNKYRKVAVPHLRAVKIKQWDEVIATSVATLLDDAEQRGSFDLIDVVSAKLPMLVLAQVMGVPEVDAPKMVDWTNRLTSSDPDDRVDEASLAAAREDLMGYFEMLTEQRRREPTTDLLSILANGAVDGRPLTAGELSAYYIVLVAAGNETTRHLVTGGTLALHRTPGSWDRIMADEALIAPAVEEMFRFVTPVACMRRTAVVDHELEGRRIAAGDKVALWFSAANRDPAVFEAPDEFRIDRTPNEHLTFGWGVHFCLGAHLARAEIRAFFAELRRRGLRLDLTAEPERLGFNIFRGWTSMPVTVASAHTGA